MKFGLSSIYLHSLAFKDVKYLFILPFPQWIVVRVKYSLLIKIYGFDFAIIEQLK